MDLPPEIIHRCRSGEQVSAVEFVSSMKKDEVHGLLKSGDEEDV